MRSGGGCLPISVSTGYRNSVWAGSSGLRGCGTRPHDQGSFLLRSLDFPSSPIVAWHARHFIDCLQRWLPRPWIRFGKRPLGEFHSPRLRLAMVMKVGASKASAIRNVGPAGRVGLVCALQLSGLEAPGPGFQGPRLRGAL